MVKEHIKALEIQLRRPDTWILGKEVVNEFPVASDRSAITPFPLWKLLGVDTARYHGEWLGIGERKVNQWLRALVGMHADDDGTARHQATCFMETRNLLARYEVTISGCQAPMTFPLISLLRFLDAITVQTTWDCRFPRSVRPCLSVVLSIVVPVTDDHATVVTAVLTQAFVSPCEAPCLSELV